MSVGIVVVSHSHDLAQAAVEFALQMVAGEPPHIAIAAGTDGGGLGTDAMKIMGAIEEANSGDGVVVLTDLGSAILSSDMALEFLGNPDDVALVGAPFVEGLLSAIVTAAAGANVADVCWQARNALEPKLKHIGPGQPAGTTGTSDPAPAGESVTRVRIANPQGLHARPAAQIVHLASQYDATITMTFDDETVPATSPMEIAGLGTEGGDEIELRANGAQANEALAALQELIAGGFGEAN